MKILKKGIVTDALALAGGGVAAGKVNTLSGSFIKNEKVRAAAPAILGLILMSQKNKTMQNVGAGMFAVGSQKLIAQVVPGLAGYQVDDVIDGAYDEYDELNGPNNVLNGPGQVINGMDEDSGGYDE